MIYVLDQNYFRSDALRELCLAEPAAKFVIPDIALLEMCKGPKWLETMQGSLETLAEHPTRVFHSLAVGETLNRELRTLKSIEGHLLPRDFKALIRSVLEDIKAGTVASGLEIIKSRIAQAQQEIHAEELNHARNRHSLLTRTEIIKKALEGGPLKELRSGVSDDDRLGLIRSVSLDLLKTFLAEKEGHPANKITAFLRTRPMLLRYYYLSVRHAVEWARTGGLESYPAEKVTNDMFDQEYVAIGSFFDRLLSREQRVMDSDADLRRLLSMRV